MEEINFGNDGIIIKFKDDYSKGDYSKSKMLITQYFKKGKAIHITLNERETAFLFKKMQELGIKSL